MNGVCFEVEAYIDAYSKRTKKLKTVATGGFGHIIKHPCVVHEPNLVIIGLNRILEHAVGL
jgi:pantothenate kinase type III